MEPYELCRAIAAARTDDEVFPQATASGSGFAFWSPAVRVAVGKEIARGAAGVVYHGTFDGVPVALRVSHRGATVRTDAAEVRLQTKLYCHVRDRPRALAAGAARVPETLFAARIPKLGRALGMQRVERTLLAHVRALRTPRAQIAALRAALRSVAQLLAVLQADLRFMHGDLHGGNVMVGERGAVFVIDFSMSSVARRGGGREITDDRYEAAPFNAHLDLLTLLTSLREDLALSGHEAAARWCDGFVRPYWDAVRAGLAAGWRAAVPFGARATVRSAIGELEESGEIWYAHHLLYEEFGRAHYPPCSPQGLLRALARPRSPSPSGEWRARIFEDV
jgi:hypothetical protein